MLVVRLFVVVVVGLLLGVFFFFFFFFWGGLFFVVVFVLLLLLLFVFCLFCCCSFLLFLFFVVLFLFGGGGGCWGGGCCCCFLFFVCLFVFSFWGCFLQVRRALRHTLSNSQISPYRSPSKRWLEYMIAIWMAISCCLLPVAVAVRYYITYSYIWPGHGILLND